MKAEIPLKAEDRPIRFSTAIRLGRSYKGVSQTNVAGTYAHTTGGILFLDSIAAAHLGLYRDIEAYRGDYTVVAARVTFEIINAFPVLAQRVKTINYAFAKSLCTAGLPFESREWSLFRAINELDLKGNKKIADLMQGGSL